MRSSVTAVLAAALWFAPAAPAQDEPAPPGPQTHFESDPNPEPLSVTGNPLDWAGRRVGIDVRRFELPRGHEGAYRFAARFPVIDSVSNDPLYMKQWTEETADRIGKAHRENGIAAVADAIAVLRGTTAFPQEAPDLGSWPDVKAALDAAPFTPKYRAALEALALGFVAARALARRARADLSPDDLAFFDANPGYYLAPDGERMPSITGNVDTHFAFIDRARKVRFAELFRAATLLVAAVRIYAEATRGFGPADCFADAARSAETLAVETPAGRFVVAGTGDDVHQADAAFLVDLGGNDVYRNNAGGCGNADVSAALCVDHGGHDVYSAPERRYVQGFGFLGVGILADLGGDDVYEARHFCQGAGILGTGALWDLGGDDRYTAHAFCQGAGMFGLGMLLDGAGEDVYDCATLGQGGATTLGLGILTDRSGDDRYHLNVGPGKDALGNLAGYGQGGAMSFRAMPWRNRLTAYGGVGMLLDHGGNDRYRSRGWCDQGGSYIMSLGALVDDAGNDHYSAGTGQGSGIHITNAILVDRDGHDLYEGGFRTGASGGDRSPGFLLDYKGNDTYVSRTSSYGTACKPFALSLFVDYGGDDTYICPNPKERITFNNWDSFGGVWPESEPHLWPSAICLDLGGRDDYRVRNRANDTARHSFGHGIHLDMEWKGGDVIGTVPDPLPPYGPLPLPGAAASSPFAEDIRALQDPDLFRRFSAVGRLVAAGAAALPALVDALASSEHRSYTRDLHEVVHHLLAAGAIGAAEAPAFLRLLDAKDAEVRTLTADDCGFWKIPGAEKPLLRAAGKDPAGAVRAFALGALLALESKPGLALARTLARTDPNEDVRRAATRFLARVDDGTDPAPGLMEIVETDPASSVKVAAAEGLGSRGNAATLPALRAAAASGDVYLQRAAGRALAFLGEREGVAVLIRSLSFPSIDAFFNYDRNVPNTLAALTGHDFEGDARYQQARWEAWFAEHGATFDLEGNVAAHKAYAALEGRLRGQSDEEKIAALEAFLEERPGAARARGTLAGVLNRVAWDLATAPRDSERFRPAEAVRLARRCVELDPQPNTVDTLAEALLAAGEVEASETICREALVKHPGERMFLDRIARIRAARASSASWETLGIPQGAVAFPTGFEKDAAAVAEMLARATTALNEWSGREDAVAGARVTLHPEPCEEAREGFTSVALPATAGAPAVVHLLAPSAHGPGGRTAAGEPFDEAYVHKNLVHELAHLAFFRITQDKPEGWRIGKAPAWFAEGFAEYLGLTLSSEHSRTVTLGLYRKRLEAPGAPVALVKRGAAWGFDVEDVYLDGAMVLLFLHETFGPEKVRAVLEHPAAHFEDALPAALGLSWPELYERWLAWAG